MVDKLAKLRKKLSHLDDVVELILALVVAAAIVVEMVRLVPLFYQFVLGTSPDIDFSAIMNSVMVLAIGIEFFKMLLKPSMQNVTEVLIFLIARHIIVVDTTPAIDNLISVISISILFILQHVMKGSRKKEEVILDQIKDRFTKLSKQEAKQEIAKKAEMLGDALEHTEQ